MRRRVGPPRRERRKSNFAAQSGQKQSAQTTNMLDVLFTETNVPRARENSFKTAWNISIQSRDSSLVLCLMDPAGLIRRVCQIDLSLAELQTMKQLCEFTRGGRRALIKLPLFRSQRSRAR